MNIVFDWAGTLADDQELTWRLTDGVIRSFGGVPIGFESYRREFALPAQGFYAAHCPGVPFDDIEEAFKRRCRAEYPASVRLWPGAREALGYLAFRHRLLLFTSLDQEMIEATLESMGLRHLFFAIRGSVLDKARTLGPWLGGFSLSPDETAAVGDMPHDLRAAKAAGIASLGVTYGYGGRDALATEEPEGLFDSLDHLLRHFEKARSVEGRYFPVATVGGLIFDAEGRVLLVRTRKWGNRFGIPGGKIDYGETMEAAFAREALEETGLAVTDIRFVMVQDCVDHPEFHRPRHFILLNFTAKAAGSRPEVKLNHESQESRWVHPREAMELDLNGPTRLLLQRLDSKEPA